MIGSPLKFALGLLAVFLVFVLAMSLKKTSGEVHVNCDTTKGPMAIVVKPEWSPLGAERFLQMVDDGYFSGVPLFRCIAGFVCQFGPVPPRPQGKAYPPFQDDPLKPELREFKPGYLSFAGFAANSRANHIFIALGAVPSLGTQPWETPFGYVEESSMGSTVSKFTTSYGETAPNGAGPEPAKIEAPDGADYLRAGFPELDSIVSCSRSK